MRIGRIAIHALLLLAACKGFPLPWWERGDTTDSNGSETSAQGIPPGSVAVEMQDIAFDGKVLRGRLLIGAKEQSIRLDRRLFETVILSTESVKECGTDRSLSFIIMDTYIPKRTEQDMLVINPGFWYGKQVTLPLFTRELAEQQGAPDCVDARFLFHGPNGQPAAELAVHAERPTDASSDAGTPAP